LRRIAMRDSDNKRIENYPIEVRAKTGTLNFVSALAGYVETAGGSDVVFAIFSADLDRRARGKAAGDEVPAGSIEWNRRAKRLQQVLLQRWGLTHTDNRPFSQGVDIDAQLTEGAADSSSD
jgi:D-alanyl-D-alanine carboxypeptidase/D-alanyl-D-alanine-endopeptidase (penicillin-binding protein 4)